MCLTWRNVCLFKVFLSHLPDFVKAFIENAKRRHENSRGSRGTFWVFGSSQPRDFGGPSWVEMKLTFLINGQSHSFTVNVSNSPFCEGL